LRFVDKDSAGFALEQGAFGFSGLEVEACLRDRRFVAAMPTAHKEESFVAALIVRSDSGSLCKNGR
jgi:hypothetical protein